MVGGKPLKLEVGRVAEQANSAVLATLGETVVLITIVASGPREDLDYFPLTVEYQEKLYAGGIIKGSRWVKREGRPSDDAVLSARLIDRSIRPLFPEGFSNEVQIIVTVLSVDSENDADIPALIGTSAALAVSDIPFDGPVGSVRLGLKREGDKASLMVNPTYAERDESYLDLVVSGVLDAIVMVEAGANEVSEAEILDAFSLAQKEINSITQGIADFAKKVGKKKMTYEPNLLDPQVLKNVAKDAAPEIQSIMAAMAKLERFDTGVVVEALFEKYHEEVSKADIRLALDTLVKKAIRKQTLTKKIRLDGRKPDEIRPLSSEVAVLPRTHGSALFARGATQALTITTLASPSLELLIETMEGEETKRYIHHYHMPPYTVGETGRIGWPSRREVGHGALAERALEPMIPDEEVFPYTIRVVSEIMSSNGSTSMASVCGSTLSLMDAGVPLKKPVSGIAMGLMTEGDNYVILSDILGREDFTGDMDFKVAGTRDGITAMQMDMKVKGIPQKVLAEALEQAKKGRLFILESLLKTLPAPRAELNKYAPKIKTTSIPVEKIGELIGPSGKVIKKLMKETETEISVNDDGKVYVSGPDTAKLTQAINWINGLVKEVQVGETYDGVVTRLMNFGAFVEILPGKEGLVHVSRMTTGFVKNPQDVVNVGDKVKVRVYEIDDMGRINLTMLSEAETSAKGETRPRSGGDFGGRRDHHRFSPRREFHDRRRS